MAIIIMIMIAIANICSVGIPAAGTGVGVGVGVGVGGGVGVGVGVGVGDGLGEGLGDGGQPTGMSSQSAKCPQAIRKPPPPRIVTMS